MKEESVLVIGTYIGMIVATVLYILITVVSNIDSKKK